MHLHVKLAQWTRALLLPPILAALFAAPTVAANSDFGRTGAGLIAGICHNSSASFQQLAEISNTRDSNVSCLGVMLDGAAIKALRVESHRFVQRDDATWLDQIKVAEFSVAQIASRHGAVLEGTAGHDAVIVQGHVPASGADADLTTSYLYNGLTGEYRSCPMTLDRRADRALPAWRLVNRFNETVSHIVVRTRSMPVLGTIGIADLEGVCTRT
jgi:hypothetical protein